jgi:hypothetical protein
MTECTQNIGYLQSINSLCVELENVSLLTFWSKILGDDFSSIVVCISINSLWTYFALTPYFPFLKSY